MIEDNFDPDWKAAQAHGLASKVGFVKGEKDSAVMCHCCFNVINKEAVPICENVKNLEILGYGFPLFYTFIRNCIFLLFCIICCYNVNALRNAISYNYGFCSDSHQSDAHRRLLAGEGTCSTFFIRFASIQKQKQQTEIFLRILLFVLQFFLLLYLKHNTVKIAQYYDERNDSPSDYSIILKNLPQVKGIKKTLKQFFNTEFKKQRRIMQTTLISNYDQLQKLEKQQKNIKNKLRKFYEKDEENSQYFNSLNGQLKQIHGKINQQVLNAKKLADSDELLCDKVILVFQTEEEKDEILQIFSQLNQDVMNKYFGPNADVVMKEAPEPSEILWQHINFDSHKKLLLKVLGWFLSILLITIATIIFYFILVAKANNVTHTYQEYKEHPDDSHAKANYDWAIFSVYALMFTVVLFNKLVMVVLFHKFTDLEGHDTTSKFQFSFALKYCLGLFFTTAIMTLAVEDIRFHNYYAHPYGVIEEESIMFFMNAFFVPLFWLINPFHLIKKFQRWRNYGKKSLTQLQANHLMEDTPYEMGKRFAEIIETMWFTYLYITLIPLGAMISMFGLIIYYWVDKYNLLRRSSLTTQISIKLVFLNLKLLDFTLIMIPVGFMIFDHHMVKQPDYTLGIVLLCVAAVYILTPVRMILRCFLDEEYKRAGRTYQQLKPTLKHTYHTEHPVYRRIYNDKLKTQVKSRGLNFQPIQSSKKLIADSQQEILHLNLD